MQQLLNMPGVIRTRSHMCRFGMTSKDEFGEGLVYKPTGFATNSPRIAEMLNRRCTNHDGPAKHRHVTLMNGRAKAAQ
eukprot:1827317-Karenia_brevis.AAC.1